MENGTLMTGLLYEKNKHGRDHLILFEEKTHTYYVDWEQTANFSKTNYSVSALSKQFFSKFDAVNISKYIKKDDPDTPYFGKTAEEIREMWQTTGKKAAEYGTLCHSILEDYYNTGIIDTISHADKKEVFQFIDWNKTMMAKGFDPYRVEWRLCSSEKYKIVGTLDLICVDPSRTTEDVLAFVLYDHKFSKGINMTGYKGKRGFGPCAELEDCNFSHYTIAMNMYRYLLENFYSDFQYNGKTYSKCKIFSMHLSVFHDSHVDNMCKEYEVPFIESIIVSLFEWRAFQLK